MADYNWAAFHLFWFVEWNETNQTHIAQCHSHTLKAKKKQLWISENLFALPESLSLQRTPLTQITHLKAVNGQSLTVLKEQIRREDGHLSLDTDSLTRCLQSCCCAATLPCSCFFPRHTSLPLVMPSCLFSPATSPSIDLTSALSLCPSPPLVQQRPSYLRLTSAASMAISCSWPPTAMPCHFIRSEKGWPCTLWVLLTSLRVTDSFSCPSFSRCSSSHPAPSSLSLYLTFCLSLHFFLCSCPHCSPSLSKAVRMHPPSPNPLRHPSYL